eukprot:TRINITY_DN21255_c0_g1_i1.p1 TRINITY_DN21255_c0_g1~~TRINITY_DN21255_c0_g1_i1.p1  ORF type:complete len:452 (-),score=83.26 TRINITY_DN21255_c0_g1_i1:303-1658(-)
MCSAFRMAVDWPLSRDEKKLLIMRCQERQLVEAESQLSPCKRVYDEHGVLLDATDGSDRGLMTPGSQAQVEGLLDVPTPYRQRAMKKKRHRRQSAPAGSDVIGLDRPSPLQKRRSGLKAPAQSDVGTIMEEHSTTEVLGTPDRSTRGSASKGVASRHKTRLRARLDASHTWGKSPSGNSGTPVRNSPSSVGDSPFVTPTRGTPRQATIVEDDGRCPSFGGVSPRMSLQRKFGEAADVGDKGGCPAPAASVEAVAASSRISEARMAHAVLAILERRHHDEALLADARLVWAAFHTWRAASVTSGLQGMLQERRHCVPRAVASMMGAQLRGMQAFAFGLWREVLVGSAVQLQLRDCALAMLERRGCSFLLRTCCSSWQLIVQKSILQDVLQELNTGFGFKIPPPRKKALMPSLRALARQAMCKAKPVDEARGNPQCAPTEDKRPSYRYSWCCI